MRPSSSGRLKSRAVSRAMGCWRGRSYCLPRGLAFTPEFLLLQGGSAAGVGPSQHQPWPAVPRARPRRIVLKALFMVPAVSDLSFVNGWQTGPVLSPGLRSAVRRPVVRTGVVRGITDSQALWGEGRKGYRKLLTPPTRASVIANAKCRSCDHAADAGAYCSSCAADIMAGPSTPSPADAERGSPGRSGPDPPLPPLNTGCSSNPVRTIVR